MKGGDAQMGDTGVQYTGSIMDWPDDKLPEPMDPVVKAKWIEALRHGGYVQGTSFMHTVPDPKAIEPGPDTFCCLGVLARVVGVEEVVPVVPEHAPELGASDSVVAFARTETTRARGMVGTPIPSPHGDVTGPDLVTGVCLSYPSKEFLDSVGLSVRATQVLAMANDDGTSFGEIADLIESTL